MFCNFCGQQLNPVARFCSRCGSPHLTTYAPTSSSIHSHSVLISKAEKSRRARILVSACCVFVLIAALLVSIVNGSKVAKENTSSTTSQQNHSDSVPTKAILDLNMLALHPRAAVEKVIGKPLSYVRHKGKLELGDTATYSWGRVYYADDHLVAVQRVGPKRPYSAALAEFGLPGSSEPYIRDADGTMIWSDRPFKTGIQSTEGLVIDSAFLPSDYSEFHISILDGYWPKSWTDDECVMWLRMSGSKIPEGAMKRGDAIYWPLNHDNTPQACDSGGSTKY